MFRALARPANALPILLAFLAGGALLLASLGSSGVLFLPRHAEEPAAPTAVELAAALHRVGLSPERLAAAGLTANETSALVRDAAAHLDGERFQALKQADAAVREASRDVQRLERLARSGRAAGNDLGDLTTARATLAAAESTLGSALGAFYEAAAGGLAGPKAARLATLRANAGWDLPVQYLAASRSEAEWVALRDALASLRICERLGEDPHHGCTTLVAQADADSSVANAKAALDANIAAVTGAFDAAAGM
ncbi:MAG: hypothetical protein KIS87_04355 [Phycisphaeraceae bacterium]|nr:hypothetical protein [Phycisphaeraceae bacterium]